jgi:hypothetical protein
MDSLELPLDSDLFGSFPARVSAVLGALFAPVAYVFHDDVMLDDGVHFGLAWFHVSFLLLVFSDG